jgi:hypothetical protein
MKKKSKPLEWLSSEIIKDELILKNEKESLINEIKKYKKEDIITTTPIKKLTLWQRILKVITN